MAPGRPGAHGPIALRDAERAFKRGTASATAPRPLTEVSLARGLRCKKSLAPKTAQVRTYHMTASLIERSSPL